MSERDGGIKVGDLVMVVTPKICGCPATYGYVFTVTEVVFLQRLECVSCGAFCSGTVAVDRTRFIRDGGTGCYHLCRLMKINPPSTPETTKHEEELMV